MRSKREGRSSRTRASRLIEERFSQMDRALAERGIGLVDAIALDIGVSSMQLDRAERGFSFQADGPLDMRMAKSGLTAAEFLNSADEAEIARVLRDYGEEPRARAIARAIVAQRPVERTAELAAIVRRAAGFRPGQKTDPATRTFQAIRIHLNAELDELEQGLAAAERSLRPGGRLAVVTFHSLEDRIVKRFFRERSGGTPAGSRHRPAHCRPEGADVRAGRQAGFPDGARAGGEPAVRVRRGFAARSALLLQQGKRACNERAQLSFADHGRDLRRRGARLLPGLAQGRIGARLARGCRDPDRARAARPSRASNRDRGPGRARRSSNVGTPARSRSRRRRIWWDEQQGRWVGDDVPDFVVDRPPHARPDPDVGGLHALAGDEPFVDRRPTGRAAVRAEGDGRTDRCRRTTNCRSRGGETGCIRSSRAPRESCSRARTTSAHRVRATPASTSTRTCSPPTGSPSTTPPAA